jgi:hypothetical protein
MTLKREPILAFLEHIGFKFSGVDLAGFDLRADARIHEA